MEGDNTDFFGLGEDIMEADHGLNKEGLENLIAVQTPLQKETHGHLAVEIAKRVKIFSSDTSRWSLNEHSSVGNATGDDLSNLIAWKAQMKSDVLVQNTNMDPPQSINNADTSGSMSWLNNPDSSATAPQVSILPSKASISPVTNPLLLKQDQFHTYNIISWHLEQTLAGENPPPLWMILYGEGGTGKSKVIQIVTEAFAKNAVKYMLVKPCTLELQHH